MNKGVRIKFCVLRHSTAAQLSNRALTLDRQLTLDILVSPPLTRRLTLDILVILWDFSLFAIGSRTKIHELNFVEVQNKKSTSGPYLLGQIGYEVHVCIKIYVFSAKSGNRPTHHTTLVPLKVDSLKVDRVESRPRYTYT